MKNIYKIIIAIICVAVIVLPVEHYCGDNIYAAFAFSKSSVVKVHENVYRCPKDRPYKFEEYMKDEGWVFKDQQGSSFLFEKDGEDVICTMKIKELYTEWKVSKQ